MTSTPVILIGGAGPPADVDFASLANVIRGERAVLPHTPVAFRGEGLPTDFSLATEVSALLQTMDTADYREAHVVGYSGGAAVGLALADAHPDRVASLMLEEPAWVGNEAIPAAEREEIQRLGEALKRPPFQAVSRFRELMIEPEVLDELKPLPPDAAWLPAVVEGVVAFIAAFRSHEIDWKRLRDSRIPMRYAVGGKSNPVFEQRCRRGAERVPGTQVDVYPGLHHLNPPHRGGLERFVMTLRDLWQDAESRVPSSAR
jgi:pimeloyl-ACP methyl ester carboxylesterase